MKKANIILLLILITSYCYCQQDYKIYDKILAQRIEILKLDNITNGFDSIQIRIWPYFSCSCKSIGSPELIILKNINNQWSVLLYDFGLRRNNDAEIKSFDIKTFVPKDSWDKFLNDIKINDLLNIDTVVDTSYNPIVSADYNKVDLIEVSTKNKYKRMIFKNTQDKANESLKAKIILNLVDIITKK